jgi:formylglycine-generating enzyme required for sulfatase activity
MAGQPSTRVDPVRRKSFARRRVSITLLAALPLAFGLFAVGVACGENPASADEKAQAAGASTPVAGDMKPFVQRITGSDVTFEMLPIKGGTFKMGSPSSEEKRKDDEGPQIEVEVDPFYMGSHEVSWAEYNLFIQNYHRLSAQGPPQIPAAKLADAVTYPTPMYELEAGPILDRMGRGNKFPAVIMSQFAARQYTKWLSKKTGRFYRLPTEAEWEYAARAGTNTAYSFGDDPEKLKDYAWYFDNSTLADGDGAYREGGKKKANPWGLYDMHGNVAEWCIDQYQPDWYKQFAGKKVRALDVINWPTKQYPRVIRGGGWESEAEDCRSARRIPSDPNMNQKDPQLPKSPHWMTEGFWIGFRVVAPTRQPTEEEKRKYWEADDPTTTEVIKRDREVRELVSGEPATGGAPTGAASAAGASSGK